MISNIFGCLFGHKYEAIAVYHYWDTSYGCRFPSTDVTLRCSRCGNLKTKNLYASGWLSLEALKGK